MPPKKKDAKKGDAGEEPLEEDKDLLEKELVISYLKMKLVAYQGQTSDLQVSNHTLSEALEEQKLKLKDINDFLVNELKARALSFAVLQSELAEAKATAEKVKEDYEARIRRIQTEDEEIIEDLRGKIEESARQGRAAQEYLGKKEELMRQLEELQETLEETKREYEDQISELERQHVQDRDKWKKTMHQRIQETKQFMMKMTDNQLEMTTKRTIMENEQMSSEMAYQSQQTNAVLQQNKDLEGKVLSLKRALALSRDTENELAKRNTVYQNTIRQLVEKLRDQELHEQQEETEICARDCRILELEQDNRSKALNMEYQQEEMQRALEDVASRDAAMETMRAGMSELSAFLLTCLSDAKEKVVEIERRQTPDGDHDIDVLPGRLEELSPQQRERVLTYLLDKIHVFTDAASSEILAVTRAVPSRGDVVLPSISARPLAADSAQRAEPGPLSGALVTIEPVTTSANSAMLHGTWSGRPLPPSTPHCKVSTGTQTSDPTLASADRLMSKILTEVRPWGKKHGDHPLAGKAWQGGVRVKGRTLSLARGSFASSTPSSTTPQSSCTHQGASRGVRASTGDLQGQRLSGVGSLSRGSNRAMRSMSPNRTTRSGTPTYFREPSPALPGPYRQVAAS